MPRNTTMGPGAEFDLIRKLQKRWGALANGLGDDAAVITPPRGEQLVASTDTALEGVHFRRSWLTPKEIGFRAVSAALSDLAAMAAAPIGLLVSLQLSRPAMAGLLGLADGIADAARASGATILGGNVSRGDVLGITTTVFGGAYAPLTRSGARPGDILYVTGAFGGPAAALRALKARRKPAPALRARFAHPSTRVAEARWLAARGVVAAIDISDGLVGDAGHMAAASGVGIDIEGDRVPRLDGATQADALTGGEEYELLVAARAPLPEAEFGKRFGIPLTRVGRVAEGPATVRVSNASRGVAKRRGHDHLAR